MPPRTEHGFGLTLSQAQGRVRGFQGTSSATGRGRGTAGIFEPWFKTDGRLSGSGIPKAMAAAEVRQRKLAREWQGKKNKGMTVPWVLGRRSPVWLSLARPGRLGEHPMTLGVLGVWDRGFQYWLPAAEHRTGANCYGPHFTSYRSLTHASQAGERA